MELSEFGLELNKWYKAISNFEGTIWYNYFISITNNKIDYIGMDNDDYFEVTRQENYKFFIDNIINEFKFEPINLNKDKKEFVIRKIFEEM